MEFDELNDSDFSENEDNYSNLVDAVSQLDSTRRVKAPTRKEPSTVVSEFHLPKPGTKQGNVVHVNELAETIKNKSSSHFEIRNKVRSVFKKAQTLPEPLETPVAERIKRSVAYENIKGQLRKWNAVVEKNRIADHLSFPLKQGRIVLQSSQQFLNRFKPKTPLEVEMAKILGTERQGEANDENELNENSEFPLTYEEMVESKKELARIRAKLSYREAKAHRQNKIKSKKYHRILKREKIKEQLKEFEQLQKTNPEAALKKLEELDKTRAEERASLRHKNTGKWARNVAVRAKYDAESRKVLAEQLKLSRDLTAKVKKIDSDEEATDEENPAVEPQNIITTTEDNPWALNTTSEVTDFVSSCKKYWENKNKEKQTKSSSDTGAESQTPSQAITKGSKVNGLLDNTDNTEQISKVVSVKSINGIEESVTVVSSPKNRIVPREKKVVKSKTQTLNKVQSRKSEDNEDSAIVTNVKRTEPGKKNKIKGDSKAIGTRQKSVGQLKKVTECKERKIKPTASERKNMLKIKVHSTSGSWSVREVNVDKRKNSKDIDDLFEDLELKLASKASEKLKILKKGMKNKKRQKVEKEEESNSEDDDDLAFKNQPSRPELDEEMAETTGQDPEATSSTISVKKSAMDFEISESEAASPEINPKKFIEVKPKKFNTKLPDNVTGDGDDYIDDEDETQHMDIVEAFGGDDVLEEFEQMKKEEEENTKLDVDNVLPGWGSWGGTDIKPDERKTKRNMVNVKLPPRKDKNKKDLIILEKTDPKLIEHMVKDVPHPFKSVGAFESNLRHPVGREWIPETAHKKFIKKPVETLLGTIIEPMDEEELLRMKKEEKSLYRGKKKQKNIK